jgi:hypothetical protein
MGAPRSRHARGVDQGAEEVVLVAPAGGGSLPNHGPSAVPTRAALAPPCSFAASSAFAAASGFPPVEGHNVATIFILVSKKVCLDDEGRYASNRDARHLARRLLPPDGGPWLSQESGRWSLAGAHRSDLREGALKRRNELAYDADHGRADDCCRRCSTVIGPSMRRRRAARRWEQPTCVVAARLVVRPWDVARPE